MILLHGRGSDGEDPARLAAILGTDGAGGRVHCAERTVPERTWRRGAASGSGYPIATRASVLAGVRATAPSLDAFISEELQKRGLNESDAVLVGFSQGTMMALHVGLRRERPLAGIIGYSGRQVAAHLLAEELRSRPPVLLVHGTEDARVPLSR